MNLYGYLDLDLDLAWGRGTQSFLCIVVFSRGSSQLQGMRCSALRHADHWPECRQYESAGAFRLWQVLYVGGLPGTGVGTVCVALTRQLGSPLLCSGRSLALAWHLHVGGTCGAGCMRPCHLVLAPPSMPESDWQCGRIFSMFSCFQHWRVMRGHRGIACGLSA